MSSGVRRGDGGAGDRGDFIETRRNAEGDTSGPLVGVCGRLRGVEPYERNSFTAEGGKLKAPLLGDRSAKDPSEAEREGVEGFTLAADSGWDFQR
mmetsp:Transcript_93821/g.223066  ORF Transcript_93821/g.223066 Transcript_93821/m.223066 type:complete len:95 (+) Transcript_93821:906-1190(+)